MKIAKGFSLLELITVMIISSLVVISALRIFNRVRSAAASINRKLDREDIADEILQRIAEDLDRLAVSGTDITVAVNNKIQNGYNKSQLVIESKYYDKNNKPRTFEKVTWQSDYDASLESLILYRSCTGLSVEDKMYTEELQWRAKKLGKTPEEIELFVPLCWGMTLFEIVVPKKDADPLTKWSSKTLPPSVKVSISFAEPEENFDGSYEILAEDIITRNIAIDRTRKIRFVFVRKDFTADDPNDFADNEKDPNDVDTASQDDEASEKPETSDNDETNKSNEREVRPQK